MTTLLRTLFGVFIAVSLTGCIEIFEDLTLEDNGSGHFREKVDMSGAASMINMMKASSESPSEEGAGQSNDPAQGFTEKWEQLKGMPGIRNLQIVKDTAQYHYTLEFDFDNGNTLNQAIRKIQGKEGSSESVYSISKSTFTRSETEMSGALDQGEDESTAEMAKAMMADMKYHITVTLPGKVKSVSNKHAEIIGKNVVKLETNFGELAEKKKSLGMEIRFK